MALIAEHLGAVKPSPANVITARAMQLEREGRDIIRLSAGEPDFDTPDHIKAAAVQAMNEGKTKYAPVSGIAELREAVCAKFERDNGLSYSADEILISSGGKQVIFNALMATLNPGDEVIIPAPYWVSYPDMTRLCRATPVFVATRPERNFVLDADALEAAITAKTRWLLLNNPGNPTGCVYSADDLRAIARVLEKHPHVWIMCDDIYEYLVYDNMAFSTIAQIAPQLKHRTLIVNGVSKAYSMTGWRIGYGAAPQELIRGMTTIQSQSTTTADTIAQWASVAALNGPHDFIPVNNQSFIERRELSLERLNAIDGLHVQRPNGAFYLYIGCEGALGRKTPSGNVINNDHDFVEYLLDTVGVAVVHGTAFGLAPFFRVSYASSVAELEDAYSRIAKACMQLN